MVDPPLLLHLPDTRVDQRKASSPLLEGGQLVGVVVPGDVDADGVPVHLRIEGVVGGHAVEELPPDELADDCVSPALSPVHLKNICWEYGMLRILRINY